MSTNVELWYDMLIGAGTLTDSIDLGSDTKRLRSVYAKNLYADNIQGNASISGSTNDVFTLNSDAAIGTASTGVLRLKSATAGLLKTANLSLAGATGKLSLDSALDIAAGALSVAGNNVYYATGADVAIADGGTGASTAANAATALGVGVGSAVTHASLSLTGHLNLSDVSLLRSGNANQLTFGYNGINTDLVMSGNGNINIYNNEATKFIVLRIGTNVAGAGAFHVRNIDNVPLFTVEGNGLTTFAGTALFSNLAKFDAAVMRKTDTLVANTTLDYTHNVVLCDANAGAFTVTLPGAGGRTGIVYTLKKTDASANVVTLKGTGAELIDGANTDVLSMAAQFGKVTVVSNGVSWFTI